MQNRRYLEKWLMKHKLLLIGIVFLICLLLGYTSYRNSLATAEKILTTEDTRIDTFATSQETDRETSKEKGKNPRILSVRQYHAGLPLRNPFQQSSPMEKPSESVEYSTTEDSISTQSPIRNSSSVAPLLKHQAESSYGVNTVTMRPVCHIKGVMMGTTPHVLIEVNGRSRWYGLGESVSSFRVLSVTQDKVVLSNGQTWER